MRRTPQQYNWEKLEFDEILMNKHFTPMNRTIKGFSIHHMIILNRLMDSPDAIKACYNVWQSRQASANYGVDGDYIAQFVWDKDYAWANGNTWANNHLISVEHANATLDEPGTNNDYVVDEKTFYNGARLIAFGHNLYNLTPKLDKNFSGSYYDPSCTIFGHGQFSATGCPGPHMRRNIHRYYDLVQDIYREIKRGSNMAPPPPSPQRSVPQPAKKPIEAIAREVINGVWGNGQERIDRLNKSGYNAAEVQRIVNSLVNGYAGDVRKAAEDVIRGVYGNGADRYRRLIEAGFNASEVQAEVNRILSGR